MPNRREEHGIQKQQPVTSRCLAIVLKFENGDKDENDINEDAFNGKDILDDFILRNKSCYWNPALLESINSLEYLGFVSPRTLLVGGSDLHLENIRTAWGRRVLKDPTGFTILSIGKLGKLEDGEKLSGVKTSCHDIWGESEIVNCFRRSK
jgi:hypothetical protein